MLRGFAIVATLLAGCDNVLNLDRVKLHGHDGGAVDDSADATLDPDAAWACYGMYAGGFLNICLQPGVENDWTPGTTIDTSMPGGDCEQVVTPTNGKRLCVIAAPTITIDHQISVTGPLPLVLVATSTLTITAAGDLLVNSKHGGAFKKGPGANPATCVQGNGIDNSGGSSGGAGGTNGGTGGGGGNGAVAGATAQAINLDLTTLRGGCPGGAGGGAVPNMSGGGGGAVYLIAATQILVAGKIDASGAGGGGANATQGGGGGGSGGTIIFDSPAIIFTSARVLAHGGGGGGGGGGASNGISGSEVDYSSPYVSLGGPGGNDSSGNGGTGGNGAQLNNPTGGAGLNGDFNAGGGGGGGGAGLIRVLGALTNNSATISPTPTP